MIVRYYVAVIRDYEARARRCRCGLVAEVVGGDLGSYADGGIYVSRIDLSCRELLAVVLDSLCGYHLVAVAVCRPDDSGLVRLVRSI